MGTEPELGELMGTALVDRESGDGVFPLATLPLLLLVPLVLELRPRRGEGAAKRRALFAASFGSSTPLVVVVPPSPSLLLLILFLVTH